MSELVFSESPSVTIATNTFKNVPIILQYENTPLIEVTRKVDAGYTTRFNIFNRDGIKLAVVDGSRIFTTEEGKKSGLDLYYPQNRTVCELNGTTLFEIWRVGPAALRTHAELYTPDGTFIKCSDSDFLNLFRNDQPLQLKGLTLQGNTFTNLRIGIQIHRDGSFGIGVT